MNKGNNQNFCMDKRRVGRPSLNRCVSFDLKVNYFKPRGVSMRNLEEIELTAEEAESLRLKNLEELGQNDCAEKMKTSQTTFQRILSSAYKKISDAIINGKAIKIIKN